MSDSLRPCGLQHNRLPSPSTIPGTYSNSCPLSQWCHPTISSSLIPFSSCLHSFPESGSFQMSHFFTSGGQTVGVSALALVLPVNIRDWFPLGLTGWISLWESQFLGRLIRSPGGPQGERGLEFSRRKGFPLHSLGLYNNNVSCLRTVSGKNLLANPIILKCKLWEWV